MEKVTVGNKEFEIKELKYKDMIDFSELSQGESSKKMIILCTGMTEEEFNELGMKDGLEIQQAINKVNGFADFQKPLVE